MANSTVKFEDYSDKVNEKIKQAAVAWLHEAAGELTSQVKRNTAVDTGQLKNSWRYNIDELALEGQVGSPLENAIWEEFGTGEYAANGNGRKTPWSYQDRKGQWHYTHGKHPRRALNNAFTTLEPKLKKLAQDKFKGIK